MLKMIDLERKRAELLALGVHDVRVLARRLGIARPTTKLKEELIEEILQILTGNVQVKPIAPRGRRTSVKLASGADVAAILPDTLAELLVASQTVGGASQIQADALVLCQNIQTNMMIVNKREGFLQKEEECFYFWDLQSDFMVYVNDELVKKHALRLGDRILAVCGECPGTSFSVAQDIESVNFVLASERADEKRKFCSFADVESARDVLVQVGDIREGRLYESEEELDGRALQDAGEAMGEFALKGFKVVMAATSARQVETEHFAKFFAFENAVSLISANPLFNLRKVQNVLTNAALRAQSGEKVLVVIPDGKKLFRDMAFCLNIHTASHEARGFDRGRILNFLSDVPRKLKNGGSVTIAIWNIK